MNKKTTKVSNPTSFSPRRNSQHKRKEKAESLSCSKSLAVVDMRPVCLRFGSALLSLPKKEHGIREVGGALF